MSQLEQLIALSLTRKSKPDEFDYTVIEMVELFGGFLSPDAFRFWNVLKLTEEEGKRIAEKMRAWRLMQRLAQPPVTINHAQSEGKSRTRESRPARGASPEETSSGALHALLGQAVLPQPQDKEPLQLNPTPVERPAARIVAQPVKKISKKKKGKPHIATLRKLNEYKKLIATGYTHDAAIDEMVEGVEKSQKRKLKRLAIARAVAKYIDGGKG